MRPKGTIEKDCYQDLRVQTAALTEYRVQNTERRHSLLIDFVEGGAIKESKFIIKGTFICKCHLFFVILQRKI